MIDNPEEDTNVVDLSLHTSAGFSPLHKAVNLSNASGMWVGTRRLRRRSTRSRARGDQ